MRLLDAAPQSLQRKCAVAALEAFSRCPLQAAQQQAWAQSRQKKQILCANKPALAN